MAATTRTNWVKAAADLARAKLKPPETQERLASTLGCSRYELLDWIRRGSIPRGRLCLEAQRHERHSSQQIGERNELSPGLPGRASSPRFDLAAVGGFGAPTLGSRLIRGQRSVQKGRSGSLTAGGVVSVRLSRGALKMKTPKWPAELPQTYDVVVRPMYEPDVIVTPMGRRRAGGQSQPTIRLKRGDFMAF